MLLAYCGRFSQRWLENPLVTQMTSTLFLAMLGRSGLIIFGAATFVLAGVGCLGVWHAVRQIFQWPKASAEVVRYWIVRREGEPNGQRFFRAVLRFTTIDGRVVTTISTHGHWRKRWAIGTVLKVRYDPRNPRWAEICCFADVWGISLVAFALALGSAFIAFAVD